ncbi:MAG: peptidoglycan-binding domain-containing protein [Acidobacteriota bacterium]
MPLQSELFRGDPKLEAAAVSDSAHIVLGATGEHVRKIQLALIQLDGAAIKSDGKYGPKTAAAVLAYKQKRKIINSSFQTQADNIVGKMTMTALDNEMSANVSPADGVPILIRSSEGVCIKFAKAASGRAPAFVVDPNIVFGIIHLLPQVRTAIAAAELRLLAAARHVTNRRQRLPTAPFTEAAQSSLKLLDQVFGFSKFENPRPVFENIRVVFRNMNVALNRSFETSPLIAPVLFVPNRDAAMEKVGSAYTSAGGAFRGPKELLDNNVPANRIYLCNNLGRSTSLFRTHIAIHELAHYVSGGKGVIEIGDPVRTSYFEPTDGPNLAAPQPAVSANAKNLPPSQRIRDADHYAAFAVLAARGRLF